MTPVFREESRQSGSIPAQLEGNDAFLPLPPPPNTPTQILQLLHLGPTCDLGQWDRANADPRRPGTAAMCLANTEATPPPVTMPCRRTEGSKPSG